MKRPKTGIFYIRVKVPGAVHSEAGFEAYQRTLGTKSLVETKVLFAKALAELNGEWARLSAEPVRLTRKRSKAAAGEYRLRCIAHRKDDPGKRSGI